MPEKNRNTVQPFAWISLQSVESLYDESTVLVAKYADLKKRNEHWDRSVLRFECFPLFMTPGLKTQLDIHILSHKTNKLLGQDAFNFGHVAAGALKYAEKRIPLLGGGHVTLGLTFDVVSTPLKPGDAVQWTGFFSPISAPTNGLTVVDFGLDFILISYAHFGTLCTLPVPSSAVIRLTSEDELPLPLASSPCLEKKEEEEKKKQDALTTSRRRSIKTETPPLGLPVESVFAAAAPTAPTASYR